MNVHIRTYGFSLIVIMKENLSLLTMINKDDFIIFSILLILTANINILVCNVNVFICLSVSLLIFIRLWFWHLVLIYLFSSLEGTYEATYGNLSHSYGASIHLCIPIVMFQTSWRSWLNNFEKSEKRNPICNLFTIVLGTNILRSKCKP